MFNSSFFVGFSVMWNLLFCGKMVLNIVFVGWLMVFGWWVYGMGERDVWDVVLFVGVWGVLIFFGCLVLEWISNGESWRGYRCFFMRVGLWWDGVFFIFCLLGYFGEWL